VVYFSININKSLLSTMEQTTRRKYDRRISNIKRRASFAGSGNNLFVVKEKQNRRILPIEVEKIYYDRLDELDLTALFMEAYNLFKAGFKYSYEFSDTERLDELFEDYKQISDLDLIFDEQIDKPYDESDIFYITSLDTLKALNEKYGKLSKMINAKSIGNQMIDRKLQVSRKGVKKTTCYSISKNSKVIVLLESDSQSWRFNPRFSNETSKLDDVF
jgi:predicted P-loop ATPase